MSRGLELKHVPRAKPGKRGPKSWSSWCLRPVASKPSEQQSYHAINSIAIHVDVSIRTLLSLAGKEAARVGTAEGHGCLKNSPPSLIAEHMQTHKGVEMGFRV